LLHLFCCRQLLFFIRSLSFVFVCLLFLCELLCMLFLESLLKTKCFSKDRFFQTAPSDFSCSPNSPRFVSRPSPRPKLPLSRTLPVRLTGLSPVFSKTSLSFGSPFAGNCQSFPSAHLSRWFSPCFFFTSANSLRSSLSSSFVFDISHRQSALRDFPRKCPLFFGWNPSAERDDVCARNFLDPSCDSFPFISFRFFFFGCNRGLHWLPALFLFS